jgi:hypothetical protein
MCCLGGVFKPNSCTAPALQTMWHLLAAEYRVLHPTDRHIQVDCASYMLNSSLQRQALSTKRTAPSPSLSSTGARIASHKAAEIVAARSPGSIYLVKSTLKSHVPVGFGHGSRFSAPGKSTSPGPASIVLSSTFAGNSRATTMKSRRSWDVRARKEANSDSPGPASDTFTVKTTVGRLARSSSLGGRDSWLDVSKKMKSPTSAYRQIARKRKNDQAQRTSLRRPDRLQRDNSNHRSVQYDTMSPVSQGSAF